MSGSPKVDMSGLCDACRRVSCAIRQQALAPRILRRRLDRTDLGGFQGHLGAYGPRRDHVRGERPVLVRDPHGPIHALFDQHMGATDIGLRLIALPVVRDRPITPSDPFRFSCGASQYDGRAPATYHRWLDWSPYDPPCVTATQRVRQTRTAVKPFPTAPAYTPASPRLSRCQ